MHTCARGCTCIRRHLKETVLWGTNTYMKCENKTYKLKRTFSTILESWLCTLGTINYHILYPFVCHGFFSKFFSQKKRMWISKTRDQPWLGSTSSPWTSSSRSSFMASILFMADLCFGFTSSLLLSSSSLGLFLSKFVPEPSLWNNQWSLFIFSY